MRIWLVGSLFTAFLTNSHFEQKLMLSLLGRVRRPQLLPRGADWRRNHLVCVPDVQHHHHPAGQRLRAQHQQQPAVPHSCRACYRSVLTALILARCPQTVAPLLACPLCSVCCMYMTFCWSQRSSRGSENCSNIETNWFDEHHSWYYLIGPQATKNKLNS